MKSGVLKYFLGDLDTFRTPFLSQNNRVRRVSKSPKKYFRTPFSIDFGQPFLCFVDGKQKKTKKSAAGGKSTSKKHVGYNFFKDVLPFEEHQQMAVLNCLIDSDYDMSKATDLVHQYRRERFVFISLFFIHL